MPLSFIIIVLLDKTMTSKKILENQHLILHLVKQAREKHKQQAQTVCALSSDPSSLLVMLKSLNLAEFLTSHHVQLVHDRHHTELTTARATGNERSVSNNSQKDEKQHTIPRTH